MIAITKKFIQFILQSRNNFPADKEKWPLSWKTIEYKTYTRTLDKKIYHEGETTRNEKMAPIMDLLKKRRSRRDFLGEELTADEVLDLLLCSAGTMDAESRSRAYASGGQLYPVETYYISTGTTKLPKGIYHFSPFDNSLSYIKSLPKDEPLSSLTGAPYDFLNKASGCIVCTLTPKRNVPKYGWLGLKLGLIETGEIVQNIYLASAALNIKCCALAGFNGEKTDALLEIDGLNELSVLIVAIGK